MIRIRTQVLNLSLLQKFRSKKEMPNEEIFELTVKLHKLRKDAPAQ